MYKRKDMAIIFVTSLLVAGFVSLVIISLIVCYPSVMH